MKKYIFKISITVFLVLTMHSNLTGQTCIQCDENSNASGNYASVMGMSTTATYDMAFAGGFNSHANGFFAFAFGNQVTALGANTLAIGNYIQTAATGAMVLGCGPNVTSPLINNKSNSFMIGFNSTKPTFLVTKAIGNDRTGKIGIGDIPEPQAKLHIIGDNDPVHMDENASLFIESKGSYFSTIWLGDKNHSIKTMPGSNFFFNGGNNDFVFENGNIGVGISNPVEALEVNGNIKQSSGYKIETEQIISQSEKGLQLYNFAHQGIFISERGTIGINNPKPATTLDVNGKIKTTSLQIPDPAPDVSGEGIEGNLLQSYDSYGNTRWVPQSSIDDGDWVKTNDNIYHMDGKVGIGTSQPGYKLEVAGDLKFTGNLFDADGLFKTGKWDKNGNDQIYYNDGNVGIGTDTPDNTLEVKGTTVLDFNQGNTAGNALILKSGDEQLKIMDIGDGDYGIIGNQANNTYIKAFSNDSTNGASIFLNKNGNVGINNENPAFAVDVNGDISLSGQILQNGIPFKKGVWEVNDNDIYYNQGRVGIGTTGYDDFKLAVNGKIIAEELKIIESVPESDFVFYDDYSLKSLSEVESYIKQHKHLPEVPSAAEFKENGYGVGEMDDLLLRKVEELTLYLIEQQKTVENQQRIIEKQQEDIGILKKLIEKK
nr:hypothetical protein [Bacteroidota bacterium]